MQFELVNKKFEEISAELCVVFVVNKDFEHRWIKHKDLLEKVGFKGEEEESALFANEGYLYIGLGSLELEDIRIGASIVSKLIKKTGFVNIKIGSYINKCAKQSTMSFIEGFMFGFYEFTKYKSCKTKINEIKILISHESYNEEFGDISKAKFGLEKGQIIANATNFAKDIVNSIPNDYTPKKMADDALKLSKELQNVSCEIYDEKFLLQNNMNAFLAVNRASVHPPRLIHLIYKPQNSKKRVIFVGKGLTYDSGGLSLKPSDSMVSMKSDKSGAAAAMAIIKGASELALPFEIHAIIGATENMIGGDAYKPDDVLVAKNGTTIEIRNTDAEGRLVLADCLCYAQEFAPDLLVDMATLTGACVVAVGEFTVGLMGHNDKLKEQLKHSSNKSGELINSLDFNRHLKKLLKSSIADISNISSSRYGGAITAALFLDKFIQDEYKDKWLHLDIAGPAYREKEWGYNGFGATGAGVRMNLYWLLDQEKELK